MRVYCPCCGESMTENEGVLSCENSLEMSPADTQALKTWISQKPEEQLFGYQVGGSWFCPACGTSCSEEKRGLVQCPNCRRSLSVIMRTLVERFKHE